MERCSTFQCSPRVVKGDHHFTLEKYSLCKGIGVGRSIKTNGFTVGGHKWVIAVFPDGSSHDKTLGGAKYEEGHVYFDIHVGLMSEGDGVLFCLEIILLDQSGNANHRISSCFRAPYVISTHQYRGFPCFIDREVLEKSSYLKDDCLKIKCTIGVVMSCEPEIMSPSIAVPECDDIRFDFLEMLMSDEGSDVVLNVAGEKFRAHKVILAARSSVFESMFASHLVYDQHEMVITNVEPQVFKALLYFIYSDTLPENERSLVAGYAFGNALSSTIGAKLLAAAHEYDLKRLKSICECHLWRSISLNRFAEILSLAETFNTSELKHLCLEYSVDYHDALVELGFISKERSLSYPKEKKNELPDLEEEASESASVTLRRTQDGSHMFVVENYSLHKGIDVNEAIESEEFTVAGHRWTICLYPAGKSDDDRNAGFASLYVNLKSSTSNVVHFFLEMYLLNQSGKGNDWGFSCSGEQQPPTEIPYLIPGLKYGSHYFISRSSLESSDYLKDDRLKIRATIRVLTYQNQSLPLIKVPEPNIGADFGKLLQSKQGADVYFKVDSERFCAHKWILAARCPVFMPHLSDCHQPKEIYIPNVEPKIFEAMLWFVYTGTLLEEEREYDSNSGSFMLTSFMSKMLAAADQFELRRLKSICESRISKRISGESVAYLLHLAELCRAEELKAACLRFGAGNEAGILDVMGSDGRQYLKETCPLLFLELAYKESYSFSGHQEYQYDIRDKIFSAVKESFVGILGPHVATDKKHKIKEV